jgi:hypothetical protein
VIDMEASWVNIDELLPLEALAPKLESLQLRNFLLHRKPLFSALTSLTSLNEIQLDCIALSGSLTWREFWYRVKCDLVDRRAPDRLDVVFRRVSRESHLRLYSSSELMTFLYANGICPLHRRRLMWCGF